MLRPRDVIALVLTMPKTEPIGPYRLQTGDRVQISGVPDSENPNRDTHLATVAPDGNLSLKWVGEVPAVGKTLGELSEELTRRYARFLRHPRVVASPETIGSDSQELRTAFSFGDRQGLEVTVGPAGTINLPRIGAVRAGGQTAGELAAVLTSRYAEVLPGSQVSVTIRRLVPRRVHVLGMVQRPGPVDLSEAGSLFKALAHAGGWTPAANLQQVVVIGQPAREDEKVKPLVFDLESLRRGPVLASGDVRLLPGDVVVVPKTRISDFNQFIDEVFTRGVYGALPLYSSVSLDRPR